MSDIQSKEIRWQGGGKRLKDYYKNYKAFKGKALVHGMNIKPDEKIEWIEPRVGDLQRQAYEGECHGQTLEDYGVEPLAFFRPVKQISQVYHFATGDYSGKKGKPYIAVVDRPDDAKLAKGKNYEGDDLVLHYHGDDSIAGYAPITVEEGDIVSKEGARVVALVPVDLLEREKVKTGKDLYRVLKKGAWAQKLRVGDIPKGYTSDPLDFVGSDYFSYSDENDGDRGMYHVTTAKDKVLREGLKSRRETGSVALGGGYNNQAPNKVSVTFSYPQASAIESRLKLAVRAAKGKATSSQVLSDFVQEYRLDDFEPPKDLIDILGVPENIAYDWDKVDKWVDKEYDPYELLVELDNKLPQVFTGAEDFGYRVGLTSSKAQMARIAEDQIEILDVSAKKGAKPEHIYDEAELRFNPDDVWVKYKPIRAPLSLKSRPNIKTKSKSKPRVGRVK